MNYLLHYTSKENINKIKQEGLTSPYYICRVAKDESKCADIIDPYLERVDGNTYVDFQRLLKSKNISDKGIFFVFNNLTSGINKDIDDFVKSPSVKLPYRYLNEGWEYYLVKRGTVNKISLKSVIKWGDTNFDEYLRKSSKHFLFSNIPHLMIVTRYGIIKPQLLEFE